MKARTIAMRLRADDGMSIIELSVAALLGFIVLVAMGSFMISALRAGAFTEGQSATLNNVRNVLQQIEKEARGASSIMWCAPVGNCLEIDAITPTGTNKLIRYINSGGQLTRQMYDTGSASWGSALTVIERVKNTASQPAFTNTACDPQSTTLQRVVVDFYIEPTPQSDPVLNVQTSFRPRNFPAVSVCTTPSP